MSTEGRDARNKANRLDIHWSDEYCPKRTKEELKIKRTKKEVHLQRRIKLLERVEDRGQENSLKLRK